MAIPDSYDQCEPGIRIMEIICLENLRWSQGSQGDVYIIYRVYTKKSKLGISQEIDIVLRTKDFRCLGI
jgi:hypothetical protein